MNNCPNCGNSIQPGVTVCPVCNTPVGSMPTPTPVQPTNPTPTPVAPVQQPAVQPAAPTPVQQMNPAPTPMQPMGPGPVPMGQPMMNQQPPKKNNAVLIAIIGIVVIAIGVGLVLLLTKDSGSGGSGGSGGNGGNENPPVSNNKQLVCKSATETITIGYTDTDIISCSHVGGTEICDLDQIKQYVQSMGVDKVINMLEEGLEGQGFTCTK